MKDEDKTRAQLVSELAELRQRVGDDSHGQTTDHRAAMLRIGRAVQEIGQADDLERVVCVLFDQMKAIGLAVTGLVYQRLVDVETRTFEVHGVRPDSTYEKYTSSRPNAFDEWQEYRVLYRRDLSVPEYREGLEEGYVGAYRRMGVEVRCILHVPNRYGLLTLRSETPNAFTDADVGFSQELAAMLELGIARVEDVERLSAGNEELSRVNESLEEEISERKQAEEALRGSEERYRSLFEGANDAIFIHDLAGQIADANHAACEMLGRDREQLQGMTVQMLHPEPEHRASTNALRDTAGQGSVRFESQFRRADGEVLDVEISSRITDLAGGTVQGIVRDITERKRAEEALRESENYLAKSQELAHLGHWRLDPETREVTGSDELFRIFGLPRDEARLEAFADVVHPDDREYDLQHIMRGITHGEDWDIEHRLVLGDGTERTVHAVGQTITDRTGKTAELVGTVQDITEHKQAEEALRESEERYRSFVENFQGIAFRGKGDSIPGFYHGAVEEITVFGRAETRRARGGPFRDRRGHHVRHISPGFRGSSGFGGRTAGGVATRGRQRPADGR